MRNALLVLFLLCVIGVVVRVPMLCYQFWLLATELTFSELTVAVFVTEHLTLLAWIANVIRAVFGAEFGGWILGLPVTLVTIVKLFFSAVIACWALRMVRIMDSGGAHESAQAPGSTASG